MWHNTVPCPRAINANGRFRAIQDKNDYRTGCRLTGTGCASCVLSGGGEGSRYINGLQCTCGTAMGAHELVRPVAQSLGARRQDASRKTLATMINIHCRNWHFRVCVCVCACERVRVCVYLGPVNVSANYLKCPGEASWRCEQTERERERERERTTRK